ncbi:MAG: sensor histidine kinase [Alphaproteobacteria bacterium]
MTVPAVDFVERNPSRARRLSRRAVSRRTLPPAIPAAGRDAPLAALGFVGAGIAHDVRNLLAVIVNNLDLLEAISALDGAARDRVAGIRDLALSGAGLTRRLLAVANPTARAEATIDLADSVTRTVRLLRHSLPRTIRIETSILAPGALIRAAEGEIESALINLVRNAVDAMPDGGVILVTVEAFTDTDGVSSIVLSVADEGTGMSAAARRRAGRPFATTKGPAGTGLGLANVARFATGGEGWLDFNAGAARGTRVTLTFPVAQDVPAG